MAIQGRVYGGLSESERRADRRERLVDAGLELFGTDGWAGTTVERLCSVAGVATRSFYEEFPAREALLLAVYRHVMSEVLASLMPIAARTDLAPQERIREGVRQYVDLLTADPRRARVTHREVRLAGGLEADRQATALLFAEVIAAHTLQHADPVSARLLGLALTGAATEVLADWVNQPEPRPATGPMVETLVTLYVAALVHEAA